LKPNSFQRLCKGQESGKNGLGFQPHLLIVIFLIGICGLVPKVRLSLGVETKEKMRKRKDEPDDSQGRQKQLLGFGNIQWRDILGCRS